jgi:hypothetical protein
VYLSEITKLDAKPETKKRNKYALNLKNKDGLDASTSSGSISARRVPKSKWTMAPATGPR